MTLPLDLLPMALTVSGGLGAMISLLGVWHEVERGNTLWILGFWGRALERSLLVMLCGLAADVLREL